MPSAHYNSVQYVQGYDIGCHPRTGGPTKRTTDAQDANAEHDEDEDNGGEWIYTVKRGPGIILGRAHLEGEERQSMQEGGRRRAGWRDEDRDADAKRQ